MPRSKTTTIEVDDAVAELVLSRGETSPKRVHGHLCRVGLITLREDGSYSVSEKTIGRRIEEVRRTLIPHDESDQWSLADADPEEARLVVDVVAHIFESSRGREWPSKDHVAEIARLRKVVPDLPAQWADGLAQAYRLCKEQDRDSRYLDFALGARPWESLYRAEEFARRLGDPLPDESWGLRADSLLVLFGLRRYKGSLEDMTERFPGIGDPIPPPRLSRNPLDSPSPPRRLGTSIPPLDFDDPDSILASLRRGAGAE